MSKRYEWEGLYDTIDLLEDYVSKDAIASWEFSSKIDGKIVINTVCNNKMRVNTPDLSPTVERQYKTFTTFSEKIRNAHDGENICVSSSSEKSVDNISIVIHSVEANKEFFKAFNYLKLNRSSNKHINIHVVMHFAIVKEDYSFIQKIVQVLSRA